jgi:hypothetical protein
MKLLAWNCRGLVSPHAVRVLLKVQKREKPNVLFSVRDTSGEGREKNLKRRLGCDKFVIHESDGRNRAC